MLAEYRSTDSFTATQANAHKASFLNKARGSLFRYRTLGYAPDPFWFGFWVLLTMYFVDVQCKSRRSNVGHRQYHLMKLAFDLRARFLDLRVLAQVSFLLRG